MQERANVFWIYKFNFFPNMHAFQFHHQQIFLCWIPRKPNMKQKTHLFWDAGTVSFVTNRWGSPLPFQIWKALISSNVTSLSSKKDQKFVTALENGSVRWKFLRGLHPRSKHVFHPHMESWKFVFPLAEHNASNASMLIHLRKGKKSLKNINRTKFLRIVPWR
jgi:hypothetical protein